MTTTTVVTNQFGEVAINTSTTAQAQSAANALPAKAGVTALTPFADPSVATTTQIATAYNSLLAALKAVS